MAEPDTPLDGLTQVATISERFKQEGKDVIDFEFEFDDGVDYDIKSRALVDDGTVVEAAVRFGEIEKHEDIGVGTSILCRAWDGIVADVAPHGEFEADMGDFRKNVAHFRVSEMEAAEFERVMIELFERVNSVLRADTQTVDRRIDEFL